VRRLITTFAVAVILGCCTGGPVASRGPAAAPTFLTPEVQRELGLEISEIPADAPGAKVSVEEAIKVAAANLDREDPPAEILHVMIAQYEESKPQSAYVISYEGGPFLPGGGVAGGGKLGRSRLSGVVVDDQTGEFLKAFYLVVPDGASPAQ
jgi:hypothetical protein